ncbi:transposase [Glycomyces sp. L485]|uniref:transposase n=1 Tax=Glycomyces sp. L485 TaxID=2909235 RepID=UPI001F4BBA05|nr:transposase [Glycomyces sp. L485]MCH7232233.1 transposase [Glycomyces sp. L485]
MRIGAQFPLPVIEVLPDGSWRSELRAKGKAPIPVRVVQYSVTARERVSGAETIGETITLVTNLFDTVAYPIEDLPGLYGARWRVEEVFDEVKTELRGGTEVVFRSRSPEGVRAEFWGLLCLYQAICDLVGHVALKAGVGPERISFAAARSFVRRTVAWIGPAFSPLGPDDDAPPGRP